MSRTKLALDVVQDLRSLANSLETLSKAMTGEEELPKDLLPKAQKKPDAAAAAIEEPRITLVELRAFVAERSTLENRPKIKALLGKFGVAKLTELPEEHYAALKREVEAL